MSARTYLPSAQLSLFVVSVVIAGGLILVAKETQDKKGAQITSVTPAAPANTADWKATLQTVQTDSGITAPAPADEATVSALRDAAQKTSSLTDAVSRTLLVNLTNAKTQGLGSDIPTQNQLIASAIGQIDAKKQAVLYTRNDLTVTTDTPDAQKTYGNALAVAIAKNSGTSYVDTLVAIDNATAQVDATHLQKLPTIAATYQTITKTLLQVPVPQTFAPFHLQLVNNFQKIAETYAPMGTILTDPLRGLTAVKDYQTLTQETLLVFINIGQTLNKNGILFTKDEPGSAWGVLTSTQ